MLENHVIIKSNPHGLNIILDPLLPFPQLLREVQEKFRQTAKFFRHAQIALAFSGRELSADEERLLTEAIVQNSGLQVVCLMEEDEGEVSRYRLARNSALALLTEEEGYLHYGDVVKGEQLEKLCSVVVIGSVLPGAIVKSCGNILILGSCQGTVWAGCAGAASSFVAATDLRPHQLQIASKLARSAITRRAAEVDYAVNPQVAYLDEEAHITIRPLSRKALELLLMQKSRAADDTKQERSE